jgi:hypothetical protein
LQVFSSAGAAKLSPGRQSWDGAVRGSLVPRDGRIRSALGRQPTKREWRHGPGGNRVYSIASSRTPALPAGGGISRAAAERRKNKARGVSPGWKWANSELRRSERSSRAIKPTCRRLALAQLLEGNRTLNIISVIRHCEHPDIFCLCPSKPVFIALFGPAIPFANR